MRNAGASDRSRGLVRLAPLGTERRPVRGGAFARRARGRDLPVWRWRGAGVTLRVRAARSTPVTGGAPRRPPSAGSVPWPSGSAYDACRASVEPAPTAAACDDRLLLDHLAAVLDVPRTLLDDGVRPLSLVQQHEVQHQQD